MAWINSQKKEIVEKILIKKNIVSSYSDSCIILNGYPNIKIQNEKINCFFFKRNTDDIFIKIYNDKIRANTSEANLLPDMDLLNESFVNKVYEIASINGSNKIRDLGFMQCNNYNATLFVNGLKNILKNTIINNNEIEKYLEEVIGFYSESQSIEYANSWKSIFELFVLCKDKKRANKFYLNIKKYIEKLNFNAINNDEIYKKAYNIILRRLKKDVTQHLDIALSLAISLDYDIGKNKKHIDMAYIFRTSNMFNHHMMSLPLINYSKEITSNFRSLLNFKVNKNKYKENIFILDDERLMWSPVFIHLDELYQFFFMYYFQDDCLFYGKDFIFSKYISINNLNINIKNPLLNDNISINSQNGVGIRHFEIEGPSEEFAKIGLVNTTIDEQDALDCLRSPHKMITTENKQRLFKVLNMAKQEKSNFLIFPEFYMSYYWLHDITKFAKVNGITIITGLHYFVFNERAYNITCSINPTETKKGYKNCLLFFREKNYYAPSEKLLISKIGYSSFDNPKPLYHIISKSGISYSTVLCYEFTDIFSRASMKSKIDILFVPQMNKDTNYFSSIVESSARDLHCFIVQANTSKYGDSRITAPFKTDCKNIVQIKGGINDIVIIGRINIKQFRAFQKIYENKLNNAIKKCYKCKKLTSKNIRQIEEICNKCIYELKSHFIKGLPPKFQREL